MLLQEVCRIGQGRFRVVPNIRFIVIKIDILTRLLNCSSRDSVTGVGGGGGGAGVVTVIRVVAETVPPSPLAAMV